MHDVELNAQRVDRWELAKHTELLTKTLRDTRTRMVVRPMAMKVLCLLPPAALAPHAQLLLQALRQPNEDDEYAATHVRGLALSEIVELEVPVLAAMARDVVAAAADGVSGAMLVLSKLPPETLAEHIRAVLRALLHWSWPGEEGLL